MKSTSIKINSNLFVALLPPKPRCRWPMKKNVLIAFALLFALFTVGMAVDIFYLLHTTTNLRHLIKLHEIEDLRQDLSFSIQRIQNYTYATPEEFAKNLDEVIGNASLVDKTITNCHACHHNPDVQNELDETEQLILEYQKNLSYLITTVTEGPRRKEIQHQVSMLSNTILSKVQDMVNRAAATITRRTDEAMHSISHSYWIMAMALVATFVVAVFIARFLIRRITAPIDEMLIATQKIAAGDLGYQSNYRGDSEFAALIETFNKMSQSLADKEQMIKNNLDRLNQLNTITLPLHTTQDMRVVINYLRTCMTTLVDVEMTGILLPAQENNDRLVLHIADTILRDATPLTVDFTKEEVQRIFEEHKEMPVLYKDSADPQPFTRLPAAISLRNLLVIWLLNDKELRGALFFINKKSGGFLDEDLKILGILANNISVALENIRLYIDLQHQMEELRKTQRQLIEAEKLTALGTLAGGVAHDFNNILCGIIGYVALLKRNHQPEDRDYKMLETIEKAGFRAAALTKQLLTFARQEMTAQQPVNFNDHVRNVISLLENTISKMICIKPRLADPLPQVLGDPTQLEQVVMNLCVNARDAMPNGGDLTIRTEVVTLNKESCKEQPDAKPGRYAKLTVEDQGQGIDAQVLPRIFEPFFTTKEFGKGTGLGLALVYGITKNHRGFCKVTSQPGRGSIFEVYLPIIPHPEMSPPEIGPHNISLPADATVLVVDDEEIICNTLAQHLEDLGCRTLQAANGAEAVDLFARHRDEINLVILDVNMPVMDGKEAFRQLRQLKPDLKVLVSTGYAIDGASREIIENGALGYIQKPYSLDEIASRIASALKQ